MVGETANAILGRRLEGENDEDQSVRKEDLASFEKRRTEAFESLPLLADGATIEAAHRLNEAVWALEQKARQGRTVSDGRRAHGLRCSRSSSRSGGGTAGTD